MGGTWNSALRRSTATRLTPTARLACRVHLAAPDRAGAPGRPPLEQGRWRHVVPVVKHLAAPDWAGAPGRPPSSKGAGAVSCQWSSPLKPVAPRRRRLCSALPFSGPEISRSAPVRSALSGRYGPTHRVYLWVLLRL